MTCFFIITSTEDKASMKIRKNFLKSNKYNFQSISKKWHSYDLYQLKGLEGFKTSEVYLGLTDERLIFLENLNLENINPELIIFASRHVSEASRPSFLIHTTGNWDDKADFGGSPKDLSNTSALLLKAGFVSLTENAKSTQFSDFAVNVEVTHHGPTILEKPLVFMELGSSKMEWENSMAAGVVANSIIDMIPKYECFLTKKIKCCLGFGGTHYAPNFSRILLNDDIAFSFICPKYYIMELNESMIKLMINKSVEEIDCFVIDWKGINSEGKKHLIPLLEKFNIPIFKTKDFDQKNYFNSL